MIRAILAGLLSQLSQALATPQVPERWVHALAQIETGGVARSGDKGRAAGLYQFHRAAWDCTSVARRSAGLPTYPYADAWHAARAGEYARSWLSHLAGLIHQATGRPATPAQVFLAHNLGLEGFARIGYEPSRAPAARLDAAVRFANLASP